MESRRRRVIGVALVVALIYGIVGALWIFFSDRALMAWSTDAESLIQLQTYKGWVYVLLTALLAFFLWYATHWRIEEAAALAKRLELYKHVTLQSIGDGVIATDREQRITLMNREASRLTGWSEEEALGRELGEVFFLEDESGTVPVENPVEKVMRTGQVVGLANHTVLVCRDGSRCDIADSGSPIRETHSGEILGVILVFRDVSERRLWERQLVALNEDLREAKNRAEASSRAKSEFLAVMSHEMRTPLNPVVGFSHLLRDNPDDPRAQEYLDNILESAERLLGMIDDVLAYAQLERCSLELKEDTVELGEICQSVASEFGEAEGRLKVDWSVVDAGGQALEEAIWVEVDAGILLRVLRNLLSNVQKFCETGEAKLTVQREAEAGDVETKWTHWEVEDSGPGIPKAEQARLFEPFTQVDSSSTRNHTGAGLGLAVSRKLVEAMGGEMGLESEVGEGCRVWFRVPVKRVEGNQNAV